jgi:hypothetical protein
MLTITGKVDFSDYQNKQTFNLERPVNQTTTQPIASVEFVDRTEYGISYSNISSAKENYLSPPMAAAFLGVSVKTLANARVSGRSPPYSKVFGRIRYRTGDLLSYVASRRRRSTSETEGSE